MSHITFDPVLELVIWLESLSRHHEQVLENWPKA
jgi:hypothetical protein